jgi:hypothetical protein
MANINELLDWFLTPVVFVVKACFKAIFFVLRPIISLFNPQTVILSREKQEALEKDPPEERKDKR